MAKYNIYCDESCHLRHDNSSIMSLGGIVCNAEFASQANRDILDIKTRHGLKPECELKWTKISPSNEHVYAEVIDYFFNNPQLSFRGYVARGKNELSFDTDDEYNDWYYKIYYRMLEFVLDAKRNDFFNIYIDIKDTIGFEKVTKLSNYLNSHYHKEIVSNAQLVKSDHIALLQLADILIGALSYKHRELETSPAKLNIINRIEKRSGQKLLLTVPLRYQKVNWFVWVPEEWR